MVLSAHDQPTAGASGLRPSPAQFATAPRAAAVATAVQGAALVPLVGIDGTPGWQVARVLLTIVATAAVVVAQRRPGRWLPATTAVVAGIVGVSTGVGIGVLTAAKSGVTLAAVAGLITLVTGLFLLGAGTVTAVRAVPGWWRLLAVPVGYLVLQFVLLPVPQAVYATNVPATALGARTPADLGVDHVDATFTAADGVRLSGWYLPSRNRAAVVLLHGAGSTRSNVLEHAAVLAGHGYGVLLFDARGHGRSGGHAMDFGWYGTRDLGAAVTYLTKRSEVDPARIGAVGLSMGGEQAITAAAADRRIRAVVGEGVGRRVPGDAAYLPRTVAGSIERGEVLVLFTVAAALTDAPMPAPLRDAVAATAPRPVLLVAGRGEQTVADYYRAAAPESTEVWQLPDTEHTRGLATHRVEWTARVTGFLDRALLG